MKNLSVDLVFVVYATDDRPDGVVVKIFRSELDAIQYCATRNYINDKEIFKYFAEPLL